MWQRSNRPVAPSIYADAAASRRREVEGRTNRELSSYGVVVLALSIIFCIIPVVHRGWGRPMMTILIGAGVSGFVLGATSRIIFLLPAALMALVVAGVLIVRADIDLGFTALAASLLNGGFLLGVVMAPVMSRLLVSPRWAVDETDAGFVVSDQNGRARARVSFGEQGGQSAAGNLLTREEARQIAVNVGKLPGLARRLSASAPA